MDLKPVEFRTAFFAVWRPLIVLAALLLGLSVSPSSAVAKDNYSDAASARRLGTPNDRVSPDPSHLSPADRKRMRDMVMLDRLLSLPPERLSHMRTTIERIERMSDDEKHDLREKIREFKRLNPNQRTRLHRQWEGIPKETRSLLRQHWQDMSQEDRRAERLKLQHMNPQERRKYHHELLMRLRDIRPD